MIERRKPENLEMENPKLIESKNQKRSIKITVILIFSIAIIGSSIYFFSLKSLAVLKNKNNKVQTLSNQARRIIQSDPLTGSDLYSENFQNHKFSEIQNSHHITRSLEENEITLNKIPKKIWRFCTKQDSLVSRLIHGNIQYYSNQASFDYKCVRYDKKQAAHLPISIRKRIYALTKQPYLKKFCSPSYVLKGILIKLYTLREFGGVWIDQNVVMFQNPSWLLDLDNNKFVINKILSKQAQAFTFYDDQTSSATIFNSLNFNEYHPRPKFQSAIIASIPKSKLIRQWLKNFLALEKKYAQQCQQKMKNPTVADFQRMFKQTFQKLMDSTTPEKTSKKIIPVHRYGLRQMSYRYFAQKLQSKHYELDTDEFRYWTDQPIDEVTFYKGPLKYVGAMSNLALKQLQDALSMSKLRMDPRSIFNTFLYKNKTTKFFIRHEFTQLEWENENSLILKQSFPVPKIVWLYWDSGFDSMTKIQKMLVKNIEKYVELSGYQLELLTNQNYQKHISQDSKVKIELAIAQLATPMTLQKKSDLIRHAVLYDNGGISLDCSVMLTGPLNWIQTIHHLPYTIGRTSSFSPQVFFFYNRQHSWRQFAADEYLLNKLVMSPGMESGFIAALPKTLFMLHVVDMHIELLKKSDADVKTYLTTAGKWVSLSITPYLAAMASYQLTLQNKQGQLDKVSMCSRKYALQFYGVIAIEVSSSFYQIESNFKNGKEFIGELLGQREEQYYLQLFGKIFWAKKFTGDVMSSIIEQINNGVLKNSVLGKYLVGKRGKFITRKPVHEKIQKPLKEAPSEESIEEQLKLLNDEQILSNIQEEEDLQQSQSEEDYQKYYYKQDN